MFEQNGLGVIVAVKQIKEVTKFKYQFNSLQESTQATHQGNLK